MRSGYRFAKINIKVLIVLVLVIAALGASLFAARRVRRMVLSKAAVEAGTTAFEKQDWSAAYKNYRQYLGRNPDDLEILKKYAKAGLSIRPSNADAIKGAASAYRRIIQLSPLDGVAYEKLAMIYGKRGNQAELAYIARARVETDPNDLKAHLWLSDALMALNKNEEARATLKGFMKRLEGFPEKPSVYVRACIAMSKIEMADGTVGANTKALENLNDAVAANGAPQSGKTQALAARAQFYRVTSDLPGMTEQDRLALARQDLEAVDANALANEDPRITLMLGTEWIAHNELGRAGDVLLAAEKISEEVIAEHYLDPLDWDAYVFLLAAELATRQGNIAACVKLADNGLRDFTKQRHQVLVLPTVVALNIVANRGSEARTCLDNYVKILNAQGGTQGSSVRLAYLQALVLKSEAKPYAVINALEPVVLTETGRPELWQLLAEAYSQTGQRQQAIRALTQYLRYVPQDVEMTRQLSKEYALVGERIKGFEAAELAESLIPGDTAGKLLRIEGGIAVSAQQGGAIDAARLDVLSEDLSQLRQEYPDRVDIRILQANIAQLRQQPDRVESELKLAIQECNEPLPAELRLAGHYAGNQRITDAVAVSQSACQSHPEATEPWLFLANLHVANADYDLARDCLKRGLEAVSGQAAVRSLTIQSALLELTYGEQSEGKRLLEVVAKDPSEIYARVLLLGIVAKDPNELEIQKNRVKSEKLVAELKQIEGEGGVQWRLHEASLWLSSDEWREKQQDIAKLLQYCINKDSQWSAPVLLLVGLYEKLRDFKRVEEVCRQSLVRNASAVNVADKLLALLERQGRYSEAEKILEKMQAESQNSSEWQIRLALDTGEVSRAIEVLKARISPDDKDAESRIRLANLIYRQTKDVDQAFNYLKEAEAIAPDSVTLMAAKVAILNTEGRIEEAWQNLNDTVSNRNDFNAYWLRGQFGAQVGEWERAEKDYLKLITFAENGVAGYELLANFYVGNERLDEAVTKIKEGLEAYPDNVRLERYLMKLLLLPGESQDQARAMEILTSLEAQLPQDPELMTIRARQQLISESTAQSRAAAKATLEAVIKLDPTALSVHLMLMRLAMQDNDYKAASDYGVQAMDFNPNNPTLFSARGRVELALKNSQMAVEFAHLAIREDPNNVEALEVLAQAAMQCRDRGLLEEARIRIESAMGSNTTSEPLLLARSGVLAMLELPNIAIPELEDYCQTSVGSKSITALVTLANLYRSTGDADKAMQVIEQAAQVDPNSLAVVHCRFQWLVAQKGFEELEKISSAYLSATPQDPATLLAAAMTLAASDSAKLKQEALPLFEQVVILAPTSIDARQAFASYLYQTGHVERAKTAYQALIKAYPNEVRCLNDLAWILQEHDQAYDAALGLANKALSLSPRDRFLLDTRGTILLNMPNRLADAKRDFDQLVKLSPSDSPSQAKALLQLGRICVNLKDLDGAKQYLKQALEIDQKINLFTPEELAEIEKMNGDDTSRDEG